MNPKHTKRPLWVEEAYTDGYCYQCEEVVNLIQGNCEKCGTFIRSKDDETDV